MLVEKPQLLLPVHRCPEKDWLTEVGAANAKLSTNLESAHQKPIDQIDAGYRMYVEDSILPAPWLLNDLVGWVVLGMDGGDSLCGDLYCRRKDLRAEARERKLHGLRPLERNQWMHWAELARHKTYMFRDNSAYVGALMKLIEQARTMFRSRWRHCEVWLPSFGLDCVNWVEAIRQAKVRAGGND